MRVSPKQLPFMVTRPWVLILILFAIALGGSLVAIGVGAVRVGVTETFSSLLSTEGPHSLIIKEYRLPRILLAWLVGGGLGISGVIIQSVIRNPLAAPDTMGVTGGAGLVAAIVLLIFPNAPVIAIPIVAFMGGIGAAVLVYLLAYRHGVSPARLALVGIALSAVCASGIRFLLARNPIEVNAALVWLTGSLWGRNWDQVWSILPWVGLLVPFAALYAYRLDILALGDEFAVGLGEPVERIRTITLLLAVALASATVAVGGTIPFIGLIAPHMARRLVGSRTLVLLPCAALIGTLLLLTADALGRGIRPPIEIPAGLIIALLGAPYFLYLLIRQGRHQS